MHPIVDAGLATATRLHQQASTWAATLHRRTLAWGGLALVGVTLLALNLAATSSLQRATADFTSEGLYTIADGTKRALRSIGEPINIRVYYSPKLGDVAPSYAKSYERVRTLLGQYRALSDNRLRVSYLNPEPFSDAEDRAVAAGLRGVALNTEGEKAYFGLAATNSTDQTAEIAFFAPDRERFLEYDITKLIYGLANPKKPVIGLISSLPLDGGLDPMQGMRGQPRPPQLVMDQIREVFEVKTLEASLKEVPAGIDVLMIVQPDGVSAESAFAIDQYVLRGGKVLVFVDPVAETLRASNPMMMMGAPPAKLGDFAKLLAAWGIAYDQTKVVGDMAHARRVQFGGRGGSVTEYVAWLGLDKGSLDQHDVLSASIERLNLASAGALAKADGATTTFAPILQTSKDAEFIPAEKIAMMPDAPGILRAYKSGGRALVLAARVTGDIKTAYPEGAPKQPEPAPKPAADAPKPGATPADAAAQKPAIDKPAEQASATEPVKTPATPPPLTTGRINAIVIADTDLLADQFWVEIRDFLGQQVAVPHAQNAAFVVGALENLAGTDALISLRGRGATERPFEMVDAIRRRSEQQFREKEEALTQRLKATQDQLAKLEQSADGETVILSDKDRQAIERFRSDMLTTRHELRDVKLALRTDIDRLGGWLKFINIAAVPLLIGAFALWFSGWRFRRPPA